MNHWLHERYISRAEHKEIVAYYRKLVVQLHGKMRELQARLDGRPHDSADEPSRQPAREGTRHPGNHPVQAHGGNVIRFDFRRRTAIGRE